MTALHFVSQQPCELVPLSSALCSSEKVCNLPKSQSWQASQSGFEPGFKHWLWGGSPELPGFLPGPLEDRRE